MIEVRFVLVWVVQVLKNNYIDFLSTFLYLEGAIWLPLLLFVYSQYGVQTSFKRILRYRK